MFLLFIFELGFFLKNEKKNVRRNQLYNSGYKIVLRPTPARSKRQWTKRAKTARDFNSP